MTSGHYEAHRSRFAAIGRGAINKDPPNGWNPYWESLSDRQRLYHEQADAYVHNLTTAGFLEKKINVLDFGCGFGLVAERLAPRVGLLYLWDASPQMRRRAWFRTAGHPNVRLLESLDWGSFHCLPRLDLVLVNSVVQYMTLAEFSDWLTDWASLLAPSGRIVVSDVIPPGSGSWFEFVDLLRFSMRRRFLVLAVWQALSELGLYRKTRQAFPLTRMSPEELHRHAEAAGLMMTVLPRNLTHFPRRISVVFTPIAGTQIGIVR
jgi:SAM-dependent methyltransferase